MIREAPRERLIRAALYALATVALAFPAACSSGGSPSPAPTEMTAPADGGPNVTPGQCVLSDGVWYCGGSYGNIPACPNDVAQASCQFEAGTCFVCYEGAGETYGCVDGGWVQGLGTETGCSL